MSNATSTTFTHDEDDALCWACDLPFGYFGTGMFGQTTRGGN